MSSQVANNKYKQTQHHEQSSKNVSASVLFDKLFGLSSKNIKTANATREDYTVSESAT